MNFHIASYRRSCTDQLIGLLSIVFDTREVSSATPVQTQTGNRIGVSDSQVAAFHTMGKG